MLLQISAVYSCYYLAGKKYCRTSKYCLITYKSFRPFLKLLLIMSAGRHLSLLSYCPTRLWDILTLDLVILGMVFCFGSILERGYRSLIKKSMNESLTSVIYSLSPIINHIGVLCIVTCLVGFMHSNPL